MRPIDRKLLKACQNGDTRTIETLLRRGANPNTQDKNHETPIIIAAQNGHTLMVATLVQYGADPSITNKNNQSALHYAVKNKHYQTTEYLITQLQFNPNCQDRWKITPFMLAARNGDIDMLQLLIQLGANPHLNDIVGQNALHYAVEQSHHFTIEYLITRLKFDINTQDQFGQTPFHLATRNNDIKMLQLLAQLGANPHIINKNNRTALHYALEKQYRDIAQYLITTLKLDPNIQDFQGITPFIIAAQNGDIDILHLLIQYGANPHATDQNGLNALHHAVEFDQPQAVLYLITRLQINPNTPNSWGITPVMTAVQNGNIKMLHILIQHGANPFITDKIGQNILHYAVIYHQHDIAQYLITHLQLDPNSQDHDGNTPLHFALQMGRISIAQTLIRLGANPHIPNHQGETPTAIARRRRIQLEKPQPSTITL